MNQDYRSEETEEFDDLAELDVNECTEAVTRAMQRGIIKI